ncbi:hypothetical protein CTA2_11894 [Colletotrichum tanaceti]|uniref:LysM domain-containing protein n=1 Tax=Colletotrichum tanaceti TaxID=1306861 RepID=A0A4U6XN53_9PEZI|nr:hypothetical protein CTA2_11894 [Colletotrichum tanaceti]TKW57121.1 hypothetical protein CTA1_7973 [Colletotrichum tanaceti]
MKTFSILLYAMNIAHDGFGFYNVVNGDNLNDIAADFGTSATQLAAVNTVPNPDQIKPGTTLVVPCR